MSSLDNLVDMEVWQLRIKDQRNSELREREREYVIYGGCKDFSPISSFSNKGMEFKD